MTDRVDKRWQELGLDGFSTEAILGTLRHYGVEVDEAGFRALAQEAFPLGIASGWHERWKGRGQFSRFPSAAAHELWSRLCPGQHAPSDLALAVINLLRALDAVMEGKPDDGARETRFKVVEGYLATLPPPGVRRERYVAELVACLSEWMDVVDRMGEALATKRLDAEADRFVAIEGALFPVRARAARALVTAARGDRDAAEKELEALLADPQESDFARLAAADALLDLELVEPAKRATLAVLDRAEAARDVELAAQAVPRLQRVLEANPRTPDRLELLARAQRLLDVFGPAPAGEQ